MATQETKKKYTLELDTKSGSRNIALTNKKSSNLRQCKKGNIVIIYRLKEDDIHVGHFSKVENGKVYIKDLCLSNYTLVIDLDDIFYYLEEIA